MGVVLDRLLRALPDLVVLIVSLLGQITGVAWLIRSRAARASRRTKTRSSAPWARRLLIIIIIIIIIIPPPPPPPPPPPGTHTHTQCVARLGWAVGLCGQSTHTHNPSHTHTHTHTHTHNVCVCVCTQQKATRCVHTHRRRLPFLPFCCLFAASPGIFLDGGSVGEPASPSPGPCFRCAGRGRAASLCGSHRAWNPDTAPRGGISSRPLMPRYSRRRRPCSLTAYSSSAISYTCVSKKPGDPPTFRRNWTDCAWCN